MNIESFRILIDIFKLFRGVFCLTLCFVILSTAINVILQVGLFLKIGKLILRIALIAPQEKNLGSTSSMAKSDTIFSTKPRRSCVAQM